MTGATRPSGGLEGYAVLVTGGGSGIGRGCAAQLAADGAAVTICGRTESKLEDAAKIANVAAGLVVAKLGTATVYPRDIVAEIHKTDMIAVSVISVNRS